VIRLPSVRVFAVLLVTFRLAVLPAEAVAPLKLLEKGVSKEALAGLVRLLHRAIVPLLTVCVWLPDAIGGSDRRLGCVEMHYGAYCTCKICL